MENYYFLNIGKIERAINNIRQIGKGPASPRAVLFVKACLMEYVKYLTFYLFIRDSIGLSKF